jgi:PAS domain S-box-containing protein
MAEGQMGKKVSKSQIDDEDADLGGISHAFSSFFEHAAAALTVVDLDGVCRQVNPAFCEMLGYTKDELIGQPVLNLTHPDDHALTLRDRKSSITENKSNRTEKRFIHKDGHIIWAALDRAVVYDDNGNPDYTIGQIQDITELKETQERLRKQEETNSRAISGSNDGLWEYNLKTGYVFRSLRWHSMLGFKPEEIPDTRQGFIDLVHPDDIKNLEATQRSHIENDTPFDFIVRMRHKKGHWTHIRLRGQVTHDENGEAEFLSGSNIDISDEVAAKEALQASEERFRDFITAAADRFWEMDDQFKFTYISQLKDGSAWRAVETIIGKARWDIPGVDMEDEIWRAHRADLEAHRPFQNFRYKRKGSGDEGDIWVQANGVPVFDGEGNFIGYRGTNVDVSAEVETILAREESEKKFRAIFEMAGDAIMVSDALSHKFIEVSNSAAEQRGYTVEEMVGMSIKDINVEFDTEIAETRRGELEKVGRLVYESAHKRKDGSEFPVEINAQYIEIGGKGFVSAIARDITDRKEINRLKDEFVSTVSHELRTPLTSIKGALGLIQSGVGGDMPDQMASMVEIAHRNCERLIHLIGDILDMEKIEAGKIDYDMKRVNLLELVNDAVEANKSFGEKYGVSFVVEVPKNLDLFFVSGDSARLMQVLSNLLSNAAKFSPSGDDVIISISQNDKDVRVSVVDKGEGIPTKSRDQIFEKFFQADSSSTREKGGTGLGLSISKSIIEFHGGTIAFKICPRLGTMFYFDLPMLRNH